jgi:hypothetical protein
MLNFRADKIRERYNPDYDMPNQQPEVSWVEFYLLEMIEIEQTRNRELDERVKSLERVVRQLSEQHI